MAATTWMPMTRMEPKEWLLGNGEIVTEPALEMSGSGKKIRVAGTTTSVYASELDELLGKAVKGVAEQKQTHVQFESTNLGDRIVGTLGYVPAETKAKLHLIHDPTNTGGTTILWWRFKDPNSVFETYLTVSLATQGRGGANVGQQSLVVRLAVPARVYYSDHASLQIWNTQDGSFREMVASLQHLDRDLSYKWQEFVRDNRPDWPLDELGSSIQQHPRAAVQALLKVVREIEDLDEIQVPDFGDPYSPAWRTLELYETNCNSALVSDLTEYLDAAPTIEQAAELYQKLLETLRSVGISVAGKGANDFMAALLEGEKQSLNMDVHYIAEEDHQVDHDHKVSVHLPTGTFIVECSHRDADRNTIAERWEEAQVEASLTGKTDELLAYARAYAKERSTKRTRKILKERKG